MRDCPPNYGCILWWDRDTCFKVTSDIKEKKTHTIIDTKMFKK